MSTRPEGVPSVVSVAASWDWRYEGTRDQHRDGGCGIIGTGSAVA